MKHLLIAFISFFAVNSFGASCNLKPHGDKWALKIDGTAVHTFNKNDVDFEAGVNKRDEFIAKGHCVPEREPSVCWSTVTEDDGKPYIAIYHGTDKVKQIGGSGTLEDSDFEAARAYKEKLAAICMVAN